MQRRAMRAGTCGLCRMAEKSRPLAFQWSKAWRGSSISTRPTISLNVRKPSWAMYWRTCSAMKKKSLDASLKLRKAIADGATLGSQLFVCGPMFTAEGGHGTEFVEHLPPAIKDTVKAQLLRTPKTPE